MLPRNNIMIDLETFGVRKDAVVVSVGAVGFNLSAPFPLGDTFHMALNIYEQQRKGRIIDPSTMAWWFEQSIEARAAIVRQMREAQPTAEVLVRLSSFVHQHGDGVKVWAKGANFDIALLESLYEMHDLPKPWKYNNVRCTRHATDFMIGPDNPPDGLAHDALSDAMWQAQQLQNLYGRMEWVHA